MRGQLVVISLLAAVAGCGGGGTVSEGQCIAGDWQTVGYRDGVNGIRSTQLLAHTDACAKHQVTPDRSAYMLGWGDGMQEYCKPNNGFAVGERGGRYNNVCPATMETAFLATYRQGRELYVARSEVNALASQIHQLESRLDEVKAEIVSSGTAQLNVTLTATQRVELLARTQRLTEEKADIEADLPALENELAYREQELDALRQSLASVAY
jgi:hypothetical protein